MSVTTQNTTTIDEGGTVTYKGNKTTVTEVTSENVTLVWGDDYRVLIPNASEPTANVTDPSGFAFKQVWDIEMWLEADPTVENETVTRADGNRYVVNRETNRTVPLSAYLGPVEVTRFTEGESFVYQGTEVLVENVTAESVLLSWYGPVKHTRSLSANETLIINGTSYVAHTPGDESLVLTSDIENYRRQVSAREYYTERINGLWGVTILSGLAAVFIDLLRDCCDRGG